MTAEALSPTNKEVNDTVELRIVKVSEGLATRAIPLVSEWGPARRREDHAPVESPTPDGLTFSA